MGRRAERSCSSRPGLEPRLRGPGCFPVRTAQNAESPWTHVKLVWDGGTGRVMVEVDGHRNQSPAAVDLSLTQGRVGLGSFNQTGGFKSLKINTQ